MYKRGLVPETGPIHMHEHMKQSGVQSLAHGHLEPGGELVSLQVSLHALYNWSVLDWQSSSSQAKSVTD